MSKLAKPADKAQSKGHEIAAVVNQLRDIAIEFHGAQQLRERIAQVVVPLLKRVGQGSGVRQNDELSDEELMRKAMASLDDYKDGAEWGAYDLEVLNALRQRLEAKK